MQSIRKENKYYFFDPYLVSHTEGAFLQQGSIQKLSTNAGWVDQHNWTPQSVIPDWEQRVSIMYPNVEYDEESRKYKIWYHALNTASPVDEYRWRDNLIDKNNSKNVDIGSFVNTAQGVIHQGHDVLCYMESDDGINWVRAELGEFYYKTRQGEIIGTNIAYIGMHGLGVHKNENPDPNEPKYLMAGRTWDTDSLDERGEPIGVAISYSADGFHWEYPITVKTAYDCAPDMYYVRADTHNQLLWSTERNRYAVITRGYSNVTADTRVVAYMESTTALDSIRTLSKIKNEKGEKLTVTADVEAGGLIKMEVLDEDGNVIDDYGTILESNVTDHTVKDLSAWKGRKAALRIYLRNARIYTIGGEISYVQ